MMTKDMSHHAAYLHSVDEMRDWLNDCGYKSKIFLLVQNGYDDLDSLSKCNDHEALEFSEIFQSNETRDVIMAHLEQLRSSGIDSHRSQSKLELRSDDKTDSRLQKKQEERMAFCSPKAGSGLVQAQLGVHCSSLYGDDWVERFFIIQGDTLWCFPSQNDQMPELSVNMSNLKTQIVRSSQTSLAIEAKGQQRLMLEFGRESLLDIWFLHLSTIQKKAQARQQASSEIERKENQYRSALEHGEIFKKIKKGKVLRRQIWCTPGLGKLIWGSPDNKHEVYGFLPVSRIKEVDAELSKRMRLYLVSESRTLTLEAYSLSMLAEWMKYFKFMLQQQHREKGDAALMKDPFFKENMEKRGRLCRELLTNGDIFLKFKHRSSLSRRIECTSDMQFLQWKDEKKNRVKGQLAMIDIAFADRDTSNGECRFVIVGRKRTLELQAKDTQIRDRWIEAVTFWTRYMIG